MNPLLRKELRLIAFPWVGAMVAALLPPLLGAWYLTVPVLVFGAAILAVAPFGHEISDGTFSQLLVQPIQRRRVWWVKVALLALAMATVLAASTGMLLLRGPAYAPGDFAALGALLVLAMLTIFTGGLWSPVLIRDTIAAFLCTFLVPAILLVLTLTISGKWMHYGSFKENTLIVCVQMAYVIVGVYWSFKLFVGAQDLPWTGGQITVGELFKFRRQTAASAKKRHPVTALIVKEFRLHSAVFFLCGLLMASHFLCLFLLHLFPRSIISDLLPATVPMIWFAAIPFLIGCVTIAEERRLNTLEGTLSLPMRQRHSYLIKLGVVVLLGIGLGGVFPAWLAELSHWRAYKANWFGYVATIAGILTALGFYSSSLTRSLLQAIPVGLGIVGVLAIPVHFALIARYPYRWLNGRYCFCIVGALAITSLIRAFWNYKNVRLNSRLWTVNAMQMATVTVGLFALAGFINHRGWESFSSLEPKHSEVSRISGTPKLIGDFVFPMVILPDGRIWAGACFPDNMHEMNYADEIKGSFVASSNWMDLCRIGQCVVGLKSDGTLWWLKTMEQRAFINGKRVTSSKITLVQIGEDDGWKKIRGNDRCGFALKRDGKIWKFDVVPPGNGDVAVHPWSNLPEDLMLKPVDDAPRLADFDITFGMVAGATLDHQEWTNEFEPMDSNPGFHWRSTIFRQAGQSPVFSKEGETDEKTVQLPEFAAGVRDDGTLWVKGTRQDSIFGQSIPWAAEQKRQEEKPPSSFLQIGTNNQWVSITGTYTFVALDKNGDFYSSDPMQGTRPSKYHDWVASDGWINGTAYYTLAKIGTLVRWDYPGYEQNEGWLVPTRHPLFVNIFDSPAEIKVSSNTP